MGAETEEDVDEVSGRSDGGPGGEEERVECRVFEEGDLDAERDDLAEIGWGAEVFSAGAEVG
jgi:hypothetical protein